MIGMEEQAVARGRGVYAWCPGSLSRPGGRGEGMERCERCVIPWVGRDLRR